MAQKLWRLLPLEWRRNLVAKWRSEKFQKTAASLPNIAPFVQKHIKKIAIVGFFNTSLGLGRAARLLAQELIENDFEVHELDCYSIVDGKIIVNDNYIINSADALIIAVNPDIAVRVLAKFEPQTLNEKKIIGFWVWELPNPPIHWGMMNHLVHEIWTPSKFSKSALCQILNNPIKVINHPVALIEPPIIDENARKKIRLKHNINETAFVAFQSFAFSSSMERKNLLDAIEIFSIAFAKDNDARFIVRYAGEKEFPKSLEKLAKLASKYKNKIILVKSSHEETELFEYYCASDIYISLHRSEGFGLNIAESMLVGLPVLATNWSGNLEFCNSQNSILVDYDLIKVKDKDRIYLNPEGKWASPKYNDAVTKLQNLAQDNELRAKLSKNSKEFIRQNLGAKKYPV